MKNRSELLDIINDQRMEIEQLKCSLREKEREIMILKGENEDYKESEASRIIGDKCDRGSEYFGPY